jgi:arylsulfatase A-like enzyme
MVRTQRWKLVYDPGDPLAPERGRNEELYDLAADPWELTNLAGRPEHAGALNELKGRLLDWSIGTEDPQPVPLYYDLHTFEPAETPRFMGNPR